MTGDHRKIRYTSLSFPYHIANGLFGGFTPLIATALVLSTKNMYTGLSWPIAIITFTFIVDMLFLKETKNTKIWEEIKKAINHSRYSSTKSR